MQALSSYVGYAEIYLSRKFRQEMGITVTAYIIRQKIELAKQLLRADNTPISDIAEQLCFSPRAISASSSGGSRVSRRENTGSSEKGPIRPETLEQAKTSPAGSVCFRRAVFVGLGNPSPNLKGSSDFPS